ncbi:SPOR domain-containing protein [Crenobacter cavernae]|uniref:SPOR domain-containing protein n=1 Tax=Crenobacter cavernae TaxID=2290923 RepID=A0A345Y724_9NEIS|nr:SPOR domain-containing protein [Crenobacter cavernae]AXK39726.1 SPOR domain-containing protein [Crenobacter cavernae]
MSDPHRDPDTPDNDDAHKRKVTRRVMLAGGLVVAAVAGVVLVSQFSPSRVKMTAQTQEPSSGRIVQKSASAPEALAPETSAPQAEASTPAAEPGLPPSPATEITPGVAAARGGESKRPTSPAPSGGAGPRAIAPTPAPAPTAAPPAQAPTPAPPVKPAPAKAFRPEPPPPAAATPAQTVGGPPAPAARQAGSSVGYNVQLGLFSSLENAQRLLTELKAKGVEAKTETRVFVGPFRTRAEAEEAIAALKEIGAQPLLVPAGR